ncbi:MAG TPA: DNA internalization-related competence protein ComEC/Rec2 [Gemmatimonadales bacterium]
MPLSAAACLAYAAGLLAALGGVVTLPGSLVAGKGAFGASVAVLVLLVALGGRRPAFAALLALLLAGLVVGARAGRGERACREDALGRTGWLVRLEQGASPGAYARSRVVDRPGCDVRLGLSVRVGAAGQGELVRVEGTVVRATGLAVGRVIGARLSAPLERAGHVDRMRVRVRATIARVFGPDDALPAALLVADTRGLDAALRERFADAGLVHALSISGLHVGIIAAAVELLATMARVRRRWAPLAAVVVTGLYVALLGFPAPAVRAGVMLLAAAATRLAQRPTSPWAALACGAAVPIVADPRTVLDLGYQLSVSGFAALVAAGELGLRFPMRDRPGWMRAVTASLVASTMASVVTAPLVAWHFGRLSIVAPLSNLVAGPVVTVLQPTLFLALLLAPWPSLASLPADAARPMMAAFDGIAHVAASIPGAALSVAPTMATAVLCGAVAAALLVAASSRRPAGAAALALALCALAVWRPLLPARAGSLELHVLDVGQGDAVALRTPRGRWVLFDAGPSSRGYDAGARVVAPYVRRRGGATALLVLSHAHADHVGGAPSVLRVLRPAEYWDPGYVEGNELYRRSLAVAESLDVRWRRVRPGDSIVVDGVSLRVLAPDSSWTSTLTDPNSASTMVEARYGAVRFLLTGDAEHDEEAWLLARGALGPVDVLKVAHHGSATSTTPPFVSATRPRLALVSVGAANRYGHPSPEVMGRLVAAGTQVLRTDQLGTVVVRTDGRNITMEASGDRWELRQRASP